MVGKEFPMPLRDHFRPPLDNFLSWEELHGMWPAAIVQHLRTVLPQGFVAGPKVHSGAQIEVDIAAYERDDAPDPVADGGSGGVATDTWVETQPVVAVEAALPDYDEYQVRVYDARRGRTLVATIEIVSPANKDRPEKRNAFVGKCAALLQKGVAVTVVDLVTTRSANLYAELRGFVGHPDPTLGDAPPPLYAASCRWVRRDDKTYLESVARPLVVGQPLPTVPLWLTGRLAVPLDLEVSYEAACRDLWITGAGL
jgi:hypothetical protein